MHPPAYRYGERGLAKELAPLSLQEVLEHFKNHLGNFLLDGSAASSYLNRLAADQALTTVPQAMAALWYATNIYFQQRPLDKDAAQLMHQLRPSPVTERQAALARQFDPGETLRDRLERLLVTHRHEAAQRMLVELLRAKPGHLWVAVQLLEVEEKLGHCQPDWLAAFQCPPPGEGLWLAQLTRFHSRMGNHAQALETWERTPAPWRLTQCRNAAASSLVALGRTSDAVSMYEASLQCDPLQHPLRHRLAALRSPLHPNATLLETRDIVINLYSWNKADLLEETLRALADTDIGGARVQVLLNGCTDDSKARVLALREAHFGAALELIELPVNIGAPAARNWLVALPRSRQADYVAFLDDDVLPGKDWLTGLVTALEAHPRAGVAGCKILNPDSPPTIQYLYRNVSLARHDMIRISLDKQADTHDSHVYDFTRTTASVMGCCHVFRRAALEACPTFDLRYSPTQMDDIAHDLDLCLAGFEVLYCGEVSCVHRQQSGKAAKDSVNYVQMGNMLGNDVKFFHTFFDRREQLKALRNPTDFEFPY
ncbi:glycosyltransferase [Megalodesulfovibrio paquesii]